MKHKFGETKIHSIANPQVFTVDDFLPDEILDNLIKDIDDLCTFDDASVVGEDGKSTKDIRRTNKTANSIHYMQSNAAQIFLDNASAMIRLHPAQAEPLSIIKYQLGQQYEPHHDCFSDETLKDHAPEAGNRVATALLYLTDVQDGGLTTFPKMDITIPPKRNRCIFFSLTHTGTDQSLDLALHGSEPVIRGEKMAINLWFRQKVYDNHMYTKYLENEKKSYK